MLLFYPIYPHCPSLLPCLLFIILTFSSFYFKKAAEGSFDQPTCKLWACRATTAPPRYPYIALYFSSLSISPLTKQKNSIAGNRTRGANVRGLHVTNYTTMDCYTIIPQYIPMPTITVRDCTHTTTLTRSMPTRYMPLYPTYILLLLLLYREVSWCSWLSHHFHVVRVPGSNPGGTIFILHNQSYTILFISYIYIITDRLPIYFIYIQYNPCNYNFFPFYRLIILIFLFVSFKKAAEGSFDQPTCKLWACRATTAPPRFLYYYLPYPSLPHSYSYSPWKKGSIAGNRTRGTNVRGLYVTNYTTMDCYSL